MKRLIVLLPWLVGVNSSAQLGIEHRFLHPTGGNALAVHDMDADGDGDVLVATSSGIWLHEQAQPYVYHVTAQIATPGMVDRIRFGDVNSDGIEDVILSVPNADAISWIEMGGGSFGTTQVLLTVDHPTDAQLVDINGDLDPDLLFAYESTNQKIGWAENLGGGVFGPAQLVQGGLDPYDSFTRATQVTFGDLDQDGDMDLAAVKPNTRWLENDGLGSFTPHAIIGGQMQYEVRIGDVDGDLLPDLLFPLGGEVYRRMNLGGGSFGTEVLAFELFGFSDYIRDMQLMDREGDGDLDVYAIKRDTDLAVGDVNIVCMNDGAGNFSGAGTFSYSNYALPFAVGSLDTDTILDRVAYSNSNLIAYHSTGSQVDISSVAPMSICAVDIGNDGDFDPVLSGEHMHGFTAEGAWPKQLVIHTNTGSGDIAHEPQTVMTSRFPVPRVQPGDIDGDGDEDVLAVCWGSPDVSSGKRLYWCANQGGGLDSMSAIGQYVMQYSQDPIIPVLRDLDMDGSLDVFWLTHSLYYCFNNGGGSFGAEQSLPSIMTIPQAATLCDVDGDADPDIVWSHGDFGGPGTDSLFWYANDGVGGFAPYQWLGMMAVNGQGGVINSPRLRGIDMDLDGEEDLLCFGGDSLAVMLNNGGTFTTVFAMSCNARCLSTGDVDGDTYPDLVGLRENGDMVLWLNQGDGSLAGEMLLADGTVHTGRSDLALVDMEGDGDLDVLTCSASGSAAWMPNLFNAIFRAEGVVWHDADANGMHDPGEGPLPFIPLGCDPLYGFPLTDTAGAYDFALEQGTFVISSNAPDALWALTTDSASYTASLTLLDPVSMGNDFGYVAAVDTTILESYLQGFMDCSGVSYVFLNVANYGTTVPDGGIALTLDTMLSFLNASPPPDSVVGQTIHWGFEGLYYYTDFPITLLVNSPDSGFVGALVTLSAAVSVLDSLGNVVQTIPMLLSDTVECAWDPNYKEVHPEGLSEQGYVDIGTDHLDYTVHFQNTGNASATDVVIRDLLDGDLQPSSLAVLGASHTLTSAVIEPSGSLVFAFEGINLPDSGSTSLEAWGTCDTGSTSMMTCLT